MLRAASFVTPRLENVLAWRLRPCWDAQGRRSQLSSQSEKTIDNRTRVPCDVPTISNGTFVANPAIADRSGNCDHCVVFSPQRTSTPAIQCDFFGRRGCCISERRFRSLGVWLLRHNHIARISGITALPRDRPWMGSAFKLGCRPSLLRQSDYSLRCYLINRVRGVRFRSRSLVWDGRAAIVSRQALVNESSMKRMSHTTTS
jgi:hypothetical protein